MIHRTFIQQMAQLPFFFREETHAFFPDLFIFHAKIDHNMGGIFSNGINECLVQMYSQWFEIPHLIIKTQDKFPIGDGG